MGKPIISITLAFVAGILLGRGALYFPYGASILAGVFVLVSAVLTRLQKLPLRRFLLLIISGIVGISAYLYSAAWLPPSHYTRVLPDDKAVHELTGRIASPLDRAPDRTGFVMDLRDLDGIHATGKIRASVRGGMTSIGFGDSIRISGRLHEPRGFNNPRGFDYAAYLAQSGIYRTVSVKEVGGIEVIRRGAGMFRTIQDWRERIRQAFLASTHGPGSAILQAMVLGEEGGLTDEIRDRFLAAGVTHIISISGSHLGMVALICFGLVRVLLRLLPERTYHVLTIYGDPKKMAALLTLPLVLFYTLLAGGQVATVRSLIMILAALSALVLDRENALLHSLAIAALGILVASPQALFDISFQLSFVSVASIGFVVLLGKDLAVQSPTRIQRLRNDALLMVILSLVASLATGPLVVRYFNQFSLAGIVSNMVVVPFAGMVVVPLGLFSGIVSLFIGYLPLAGLNQMMADVFIELVNFFSRLPFAEFHPPSPGMIVILSLAVLMTSSAIVVRRRLLYRVRPLEYPGRDSRTLLVTLSLSGFTLIIVLLQGVFSKEEAIVSFPDVGQGDCALVELGSGPAILIDGGGTYDNRFDMGRRVLAPFLWNRGIRRLDLVILSHPHPDHMNGLKYILSTFAVSRVWTHGQDSGLPGYEEFLRIMEERKIGRTIVSGDDAPTSLGDAGLSVLHPKSSYWSREKKAYAAENDRALVIRIAFHNRVMLFAGDIGRGAEQELVRSKTDLKCDILKVPHHGSKSSSSDAFVSAAKPEFGVITVGQGNPYHHPADEVVARYEAQGTKLLRTDQDGAVFVSLRGGNMKALRWSELTLRQIKGSRRWEQEQENWKRVWLRKWEL